MQLMEVHIEPPGMRDMKSKASGEPCISPLSQQLSHYNSTTTQIYDMFRHRPDLLPPIEEGMSKESHREMVRQQLKALLDSGISPLEFFSNDINRAFAPTPSRQRSKLSMCRRETHPSGGPRTRARRRQP